MSYDINRVTLVGRLAGDVELKYTPGGTAIAKFGLAVGGRPRDGEDTVSFFNCVVWGKMGENCSQYLSKGKQVCVDGRIEQRRWQAQDGANRSTIEVVAERVQFLSPQGNDTSKTNNPQQQQPQAPKENLTDDFYDNSQEPQYDMSQEDVPF
mgnify:CR=1 FL=1